MIIERSVAARNAFQAIVKIENDFVQRQFVGQHDARWRQVLEAFLRAALVLTKLQNAADRFVVRDDHCLDDRLFDFADVARIRKYRGTIEFDYFAGHARDAVAHARRRRDQVEPEFALQPLLHNFHVQQAEKAAAKAETERNRIFRLVKERGVVQFQFAERIAQRLVLIGKDRKQSGKDHRFDGFKTGKRGSGAVGIGDGIAHARVGHILDVCDDEADVTGFEFLERDRFRRKRAERFHFVDLVAVDEANFRVRRDALHNRFQHVFHADAAFRADHQRVVRGNGENIFDLLFYKVRLRGGQIN